MACTDQEYQAGDEQGARVEAEGQDQHHEEAEVAVTDAIIDPFAVVIKVLGQGEEQASRIRPLAQLPSPQTTQPSRSLTPPPHTHTLAFTPGENPGDRTQLFN